MAVRNDPELSYQFEKQKTTIITERKLGPGSR